MFSRAQHREKVTAFPRPSSADSGTDTLSAARRGDVRAFEALYREHCGKVYGLCLRMTRQRELAEDCTQQTFIKAWHNLSRFEGRSAFGSWLHSIAVHVVLSQRRSDKPWLSFDGTLEETADDSSFDLPQVSDAAEVLDLERALSALPDGARYVMVLHTIYGYGHEEIATMLDVAVGTCKAQLHRARRMLRERMERSENEHE